MKELLLRLKKGPLRFIGACFAYVVQVGDKITVFMDQKEGKSYDEIANVVFSSDSQRLAHVARAGDRGWRWWMGKKGSPTTRSRASASAPTAGGPLTSPKWAERVSVVVDGTEGQSYDNVAYLLFDSQGNLHYLATKGDSTVLVEERLQ